MTLTDLLTFATALPPRVKKRLVPLGDITFWVLTALTLLPLWLLDPPMVKTLIQWSAFGAALAGSAVVITRILLPMIDLGEVYEHAKKGHTAAGLVFLAVTLLLAAIFLGLVMWAKT
jgi:hypothetical protein